MSNVMYPLSGGLFNFSFRPRFLPRNGGVSYWGNGIHRTKFNGKMDYFYGHGFQFTNGYRIITRG